MGSTFVQIKDVPKDHLFLKKIMIQLVIITKELQFSMILRNIGLAVVKLFMIGMIL
jgi:hypothetical protein